VLASARALPWLLALALVGCAASTPPLSPAGAPPVGVAGSPFIARPPELPRGKLPRSVRPVRYALELEVVPGRDAFSGRVRIAVELSEPSARIWLHARGLTVSRAIARQGGQVERPARFATHDEHGLSTFELDAPLGVGAAELELEFAGSLGKQLAGLYGVPAGGAHYVFTQFESHSARMAFPCFDEPSFKTPFELWLTVPEGQVAISNTREIGSERLPGGLARVHFAPTLPLPTYLVAVAVGPFDVVDAPPIGPNEVRAEPVPLRGVAVRGKGAQLAYALQHTPALLQALERYFGIAYPFVKLDLIAVPDFGPGAMENAAAITFREWLLLIDPAHAAENQKRAFAYVNAHELAHQWFGNLVTMPWWDEIWLNEAFATWMGYRVVGELYPEQRAELALLESVLDAMSVDSRMSARRVRQPIDSTHDIANAFDAITYSKGGGVLAMFERYLGVERFRDGIRKHLAQHRFGTATGAELVQALSEVAGQDLSGPFASFLDQPGVPLLQLTPHCEGGVTRLVLKQSRYAPLGTQGVPEQSWQLPLCVRHGSGGKPREQCSLLTAVEGELTLQGKGCARWVMPNAAGAGYYRWALPPVELQKLLRDGFAQLSTAERLSVADSLLAGLQGGTLEASELLRALPAFAADPERAVATTPMDVLGLLRRDVVSERLRPALEAHAAKLYAPLVKRLGPAPRPGETGEQRLLRAELLQFLALVAKEPTVRKRLAEQGRAYLGSSPTAPLDETAAEPELLGAALVVAMQDGDAALFDAVEARLRSTEDAAVRPRLLGALSAVTDARASRALALVLDPALRVNEVLQPLSTQLRDERTRDAAWQWFEQNLDAVVARLSPGAAGGLPRLGAGFCSEAHARRLEALFRPRIEKLLGGPRQLESALESLRLCVALQSAQRASADAFFEAPVRRADRN